MYPYFETEIFKIYTTYKNESYNFDSHFHNKLEMFYCFEGHQKIKIENTVYTLEKGDAAVIFPNVVHEYIGESSSVKTESITLINEIDLFSAIIPDLTTKRPSSPIIKASFLNENVLLGFRKMINAESETELLGWGLIAFSGMADSLELLPLKNTDGFLLTPNLLSFINNNFKKPLTIKYLSKEFGYSTSYITHIFYDRLKIPFRTYLNFVRSEEAANLISTTNKSLTEIAYECGFNSLNTFCRGFKKHHNMTPSEYKKKI